MTYVCLLRQEYEAPPCRLVPIRQGDLRAIMNWRNAQMDYLRQDMPLTDEDQARYWNKLRATFQEYQPDEILFSFLEEEKCIGYGGLTRIAWSARNAEVSFLMDPEQPGYSKNFAIFLSLLKVVAFENLRFHRLYAETYDIRPEHVSVLEKNGFVLEGRMREHALAGGKWVDALIHGCLHVVEE